MRPSRFLIGFVGCFPIGLAIVEFGHQLGSPWWLIWLTTFVAGWAIGEWSAKGR